MGNIKWTGSYSESRKDSSSWVDFTLNNKCTMTGSINEVGYLTGITISITNTSGTGYYNDGRGTATISFKAKIIFPDGSNYTSPEISKVFDMDDNGYKKTCTFNISKIIPLSGSNTIWSQIVISARHTQSSTGDKETILFRDGGTLTVTYTYSEGIFKYYTGSTWQNCSINYYDGTKWVQIQPYYYNGEKWVPTGA